MTLKDLEITLKTLKHMKAESGDPQVDEWLRNTITLTKFIIENVKKELGL